MINRLAWLAVGSAFVAAAVVGGLVDDLVLRLWSLITEPRARRIGDSQKRVNPPSYDTEGVE